MKISGKMSTLQYLISSPFLRETIEEVEESEMLCF